MVSGFTCKKTAPLLWALMREILQGAIREILQGPAGKFVRLYFDGDGGHGAADNSLFIGFNPAFCLVEVQHLKNIFSGVRLCVSRVYAGFFEERIK